LQMFTLVSTDTCVAYIYANALVLKTVTLGVSQARDQRL